MAGHAHRGQKDCRWRNLLRADLFAGIPRLAQRFDEFRMTFSANFYMQQYLTGRSAAHSADVGKKRGGGRL